MSEYKYKCKKFSHIVNRCHGAKLAGSSGVTHSGEQEGESQPFRGWKGKEFPDCEPEKGRCEGCEATGRGFTRVNNFQSI